MPAYIIADMEIHDPEKAAEYRRRVEPLVAKHGGTYLARGGEIKVLDGEWAPKRIVILSFPDLATAEAFYNDPDYQPVKALRQAATTGSLIVTEGLPG
jgi:uncharacterized protein (DUF1330 family)